MSERSGEADLWRQVGRLLQRRRGWTFQGMPSPGARPAWCFCPGRELELSVTIDKESVCVYIVAADEECRLGGTDDLADWLATRWPSALPEQREGVSDRLKSGRLFEWE
jgi:hypothetical protein